MACNAKSWHQSSERSETVVWLFFETFGHIWMKSAGKCCPDSKEMEQNNFELLAVWEQTNLATRAGRT
jgi:hypothetical protein